ncbi:MAG: hypothetical protein ACTSXJ_07205 [Candidatus Baldrarchaeia archaeon]
MDGIADSSFLEKVANGEKRALEIWSAVKEGRMRLYVSTVTLLVFGAKMIKEGKWDMLSVMDAALKTYLQVDIVPVDMGIALEARNFMAQGFEMEEAIVAALFALEKSKNIITANPEKYRHLDANIITV